MTSSSIIATFSDKENQLLNSITSVVVKHLQPKRIFLFGSRVKKQFPHHADFDLAIDMKRVALRAHRKMMEEIEDVGGLYEVDLVYLKSVDEEFRAIILETGKLVYEQKP